MRPRTELDDTLLSEARDHCVGARAVYLCLRYAGRYRRSTWILGTTGTAAVLGKWIDAARLRDDATLEMSCARNDGRRLQADHPVLAHHQRGLWAFAPRVDDPGSWLSPNEIITGNRQHRRSIEDLCAAHDVEPTQILAFSTEQWLLVQTPTPRWLPLQRQKAPAGLRTADRQGIAVLRDHLASWFLAQATQQHGVPYKYWPGNGRYSPADNSIRRLFGVLALSQYVATHGDSAQRSVAEESARRIFSERYCDYLGHGLITDPNGIKLGAVAVAGLVLLASPRTASDHRVDQLYRTTRRLSEREGRFRTFWWPTARNDNQNFYPGEALLFWARLYQRSGDSMLRAAIDRSLQYYQRWHRAQRNPAFVPWHTLTLATLYETTGNRGYLDDLIDMNQWLLTMQQWDDAPHPDMRGRFFAPEHPEYGPPHASSTAVYCEGLCHAADVLRQAGLRAAAQRFALAATRGLSHLRQLQYLDVTDLFRFTYPTRVAGALRTEVYDLTVRVDSAAHALQACLAWDAGRLESLLPDQEQSPR